MTEFQAPQPAPVPAGFALIPLESSDALLRPFYECPPEELKLAWQAMHMIAKKMHPAPIQAPEGGPALPPLPAPPAKHPVLWGSDQKWTDDDMRDYARAALAAQHQAAPAITEAEIDRIAALTEKAMEEGLRGFCRTWGWQQFARTLVENLRPYGLRIVPTAKEHTDDL